MIDILEKMNSCMRAIWYGSSKKSANAPTTSAEQDIRNVIDYTCPSSILKWKCWTVVQM